MHSRDLSLACCLAALLTPGWATPAAAQGTATPNTRTGSFAHLAWGTFDSGDQRGYWKTSLLFMNIGSAAAGVTLNTYSPSGVPQPIPIAGRAIAAQQKISVPAGGTVQLDLDEQAGPLTVAWAEVIAELSIRGQGIYTQSVPGRPLSQAVVPLVSRDPARCIVAFPPDTTSYPDVLILPFDNRQYTTSYAFANTTAAPQTLTLKFADELGATLFTLTQDVAGYGQFAFDSSQYAELQGRRGQALVTANAESWTAIGFLFNPAQNTFTTTLPVFR